MKYKCLKCESEFEAKIQAKCPKCGAWTTDDIMTLRKYKLSHPETPEEPVKVEQ